jgi:DNA-directed RNA polymerase subunit E'/Rpb7
MSRYNTPYSLQNNLSGAISLKADQTGSKWRDHLLTNLKKFQEGTIVNNIYIVKVNEITEIISNEVSRKNIAGSTDFKINYSAYACVPNRFDVILMKIDNIATGLIKTINGPIVGNIVPNIQFVNSNVFLVENISSITYLKKKTRVALQIGDVVLVKIIGMTYTNQGKNINIVGKLEDICTNEESEEFDKENNMVFDETINEPYL